MKEAAVEQVPAMPMGPASGPRLFAIDLARGVALIAMVVYHVAFDLSFLGLIELNPTTDPVFVGLARATAGAFLFLVGVNLVLAHRRGIRAGAFLRRLAIIVAAAALVSVVTYAALGPDLFVRFGILHAIAAASLFGLAVLALPAVVLAVLAVACFALPVWLTGAVLDHPALFWLGLNADPPDSVDFVPVLPWFGATLLGMAAARVALAAGADRALAGWRPHSPPARLLILAGQWSLAIYLLHQPLILGILYPLALLQPGPAAETTLTEDLDRIAQVEVEEGARLARETAAYNAECLRGCGENGRDLATCTAYCGCVLSRMDEAGLRSRILLAPSLSEALQQRVVAFSQGCWRSLAPEAPEPD